jgi:hypothetical protein
LRRNIDNGAFLIVSMIYLRTKTTIKLSRKHINAKLSVLLNRMGSKEIKDVRCKGRMPETHEPCNVVLYQTDGEFMYINGSILNKGKGKQKVECARCRTIAAWTRHPKYINPDKSLNDKFQRKY